MLLFEGGDNVWDDPETFVKLLAVYRLKNAMTPMLLAVGDDDGYSFLGAVELCNSLRLLKKDVTLLRYAGRGHGFSGAAVKDFATRELAYFDRYLKAGTGAKWPDTHFGPHNRLRAKARRRRAHVRTRVVKLSRRAAEFYDGCSLCQTTDGFSS